MAASVTSLVRRANFTADSPADAVCLSLVYHPLVDAAASPWSVWLQAFSYYRLECCCDSGSIRFSIGEFAAEAADGQEKEGPLIRSLARAWSSWRNPVLITLSGAAILPVLRVRSLILEIPIPNLSRHSLLGDWHAFLRAAPVGVIDLSSDLDLALPRSDAIVSLLDLLGLRFSSTVERWRHRPIAVAQITATATLAWFAKRAVHDEAADHASARDLLQALRSQAYDRRFEAPWLHELLPDVAAPQVQH